MTAQFRQWFYLLSALASAIVPILVTLRVINEAQGNQWLGLVAALGGILGTAGAGTAAVILGKQRKDGTLDTPEPAPVLPLPDVVLGGLSQAAQNVATSVSELDKIRDGVGQILGTAPVIGPLAQAAIDSIKLP